MDITLPPKSNCPKLISVDGQKRLVIIGANGSGKTRFGSWIEENHLDKSHRVSAQKSLSMPKATSPTTKIRAEYDLWFGGYNEKSNKGWHEQFGRRMYRWQYNPNTYLLDDYAKLMVLLFTEEFEESVAFRDSARKNGSVIPPVTKLDRIQHIWEQILPHRKLIKKAGTLEATPITTGTPYNASEMSDGERVIFYLIGQSVCSPQDSIIIIDEPETHLHQSVVNSLWDKIEQERPDCTFIYLTHNIDFAVGRTDATRIWLKSYLGESVWDYEIIEGQDLLPDAVYLEILGSRRPILFIEGSDKSSIDIKLYPHIFPEYTVKPLGSCYKVLEATKAFNDLQSFHQIQAKGIIDRDRRTDTEIANLISSIFVPNVAEVESILLKEPVIKAVASKMDKNPEEIFEQTKQKVLELFTKDLESQTLLHTQHFIRRTLEQSINNKSKSIDDLDAQLSNIPQLINSKDLFTSQKAVFQSLINSKDYDGILKVYNHKGLLQESKVIQACDLKDREAYLNRIVSILKSNTEGAIQIRSSIRESIGIIL
jgi:hypothetical protein